MYDYVTDWDKYQNFSKKEFECKHTGLALMAHVTVDTLQVLRTALGFPLIITSGYRHESHPIEAAKPSPGEHSKGLAADIACSHERAYKIISFALALGVPRIGVSQKGKNRFIHLGFAKGEDGFASPTIWSY